MSILDDEVKNIKQEAIEIFNIIKSSIQAI